MGESFEARLMRFSSKEIFKRAKKLLHGEELVCCHEAANGVLRAVFRDSKGVITRTELTGFPNGPFHTSCTCAESMVSSLCPHSMAACLNHAKYTIKRKELEQLKESPAKYAGLKFSGLSELLGEVLNQCSSRIELRLTKDFPHAPSKWEKVTLSASLIANGRKYLGNLNNLRQLHFDKSFSASLNLSDFPLQDRQIIRFLAINAQGEGNDLILEAEQMAEFFHSLPGFDKFFKDDQLIKIHHQMAEPVIIIENVKGGILLKSAVIVNDSPLPLTDVKLINGKAGCWLGMLGEYWWIPARVDVGWLRSFLRTTIQPCSAKAVEALINAQETLPFKLIEANGVRLKAKKFSPVYKGVFRKDQALLVELQFDYDGHLCKYDQARLAVYRGRFWKRNTLEEEKMAEELLNFGFRRAVSSKIPGEVRFILRDAEAIGTFTGEVIPKWFASGRDFMVSSNLARMGSDHVLLKMDCQLEASNDLYFDLRVRFHTAVDSFPWKAVVSAAGNNESFSVLDGASCMRLPERIAHLVSWASDVVELLPVPEGEDFLIHGELLRLPRAAALHWAELSSGIPDAVPVEFLRLKALTDSAAEENIPQEENPVFCGELRKYQQAGVFWMRKLAFSSFNVILADEMGLGKTVQTLALLAYFFHSCRSAGERVLPSLIVCPTTLVENWAREAARFVPSMQVLVISGPDHKEKWKKAIFSDLCISSYAIIKRDAEEAGKIDFNYIILDEAQHIKNPATGNAKVCKSLSALHKLVLTGTPLENSPEDLWSIMDFLHPGLLGNLSSFRRRFCNPNDFSNAGELAGRISPFILRRKKADVFTEIPPKNEQILYCEMEEEQKRFYEKFLEETRKKCKEAVSDGKISKLEILSSLLRMRQVCCDPTLIPEDLRKDAVPENMGSAKMELLKELLLQTVDSGHRVLLFSQFTSLLAIVRKFLEENEIPYEYLDGSTKDRFAHVDHFNNSEEIPVFLLSLKAGGLGLNLTSADTVILYDPWWNPTAEAQAMDRSHRIGQTKNVNCVKLIVKDSVEEKVLEYQKLKQDLFHDIVENSTEGLRSLSMEDFEFLLS